MYTQAEIDAAAEGLLEAGVIPLQDHIKSITFSPYVDSYGDDAVHALILTDDTLGSNEFSGRATTEIEQIIADWLTERGVTDWLFTRFVPESEYVVGGSD